MLVAPLLELERTGVDLVVGEDHVLGALEVLAEQDSVARGMRLGDRRGQAAISSRSSSSCAWNSVRSDVPVAGSSDHLVRTHPNRPVT